MRARDGRMSRALRSLRRLPGGDVNATGPLLSAVVRASGGRGVIVNFHTLTAEQTRRQVSLLARYFELIDLETMVTTLDERRARGAPPFCLLTFDDGKRSNATATAPVLDELGVKAVFYVCTAFVSDGTRPLWFDRYEALARVTDVASFGLGADIVKRLPAAVRDRRIDEACAATGVDADLHDDDVAPMTWDQARALASRGHTIGAHGTWHAILPFESAADATRDITASVADVRREIGACATFAYPNGNSSAPLTDHVASLGVGTVMTTEPTWVHARHSLVHLPRVQLFGHQGTDRVRAKLVAARVPGVLRNPDSSATSTRRRGLRRREPELRR